MLDLTKNIEELNEILKIEGNQFISMVNNGEIKENEIYKLFDVTLNNGNILRLKVVANSLREESFDGVAELIAKNSKVIGNCDGLYDFNDILIKNTEYHFINGKFYLEDIEDL